MKLVKKIIAIIAIISLIYFEINRLPRNFFTIYTVLVFIFQLFNFVLIETLRWYYFHYKRLKKYSIAFPKTNTKWNNFYYLTVVSIILWILYYIFITGGKHSTDNLSINSSKFYAFINFRLTLLYINLVLALFVKPVTFVKLEFKSIYILK